MDGSDSPFGVLHKACDVLVSPADCFDKIKIDSLVVDSVSKRTNSKALTPQELKKMDVSTFRQTYRIGYRLLRAHHVSATQDGKNSIYSMPRIRRT
jgi:hypothetical protein